MGLGERGELLPFGSEIMYVAIAVSTCTCTWVQSTAVNYRKSQYH